MFERARFMVKFAGAYRRARRDGVDHEAALQAATDSSIGDTSIGTRLPDSVTQLWCAPERAVELPDGDWFGAGAFEITEAHLGLLRKARLGWDGAERGAPMLDPARPYGRPDLLAQLGEVFDTDDADDAARRHVEMYFVMARVLRHGTLAPGRYPMINLDPAQVRASLRGYGDLTDDDLAVERITDEHIAASADDTVTVTGDHLQLLANMEIRWPSRSDSADRLDGGQYPAAGADPKRPYGDFTFIEVDMARILGELPPPPTDGPAIFEPTPELARRLQRLHWQMLPTMQVFLERATLAPGIYH